MRIPGIIFVVFGLCACTSGKPSGPALFNGAHLPGLESASFAPVREQNVKGMQVREFTASLASGDVNVSRLENVDAATADRILQRKRFQLESLSQEQKSPYPGEISAKVKCAGNYLPVIKNLSEAGFVGLRVEAAANSRKNIGVCGEAEFSYDAVLVYLYCKKQKMLLQIESFFPRSKKPAAWLDGASC